MLKKLLIKLGSAAILLLSLLLLYQFSFAQVNNNETFERVDLLTGATPVTWNSTQSSTGFLTDSSSPLLGSRSLIFNKPSLGTATPVLSTNLAGTNFNFGSNAWEWVFLYRTPGTVSPAPSNTISSSTNGWRLFVNANGTNPTAGGFIGYYVTQVGNALRFFQYAYGNSESESRGSYAVSANTTYVIRVVRETGGGGQYRWYVSPYNGTLYSTNLIGNPLYDQLNGNYKDTFFQASVTSGNNGIFKWDNLSMFKASFSVTGLNNPSNGITTTVNPGESQRAFFGFKITATGQFEFNTFNIDFPGGSNGTYFSNAKLYTSTDDIFSLADDGAAIATGDLDGGNVKFSGLSEIITNAAKNYFLAVDVKTFNNSNTPASIYFRFAAGQDQPAIIRQSPYTTFNTFNISGATLTMPPNSTFIWTGGANNTNFNNNSNWSNYGYPNSSSNVTIPAGRSYYPVLTANTNVASVTFTGIGPRININASYQLNVSTALTVSAGASATINGPGTVTLANAANSTINGGATLSLSSTALNNAGTFNAKSTSAINLLSNASITNTGAFTLESDINGSASIGTITGTSSVAGTINVQRYITGGLSTSRGYRFISSPVSVASNNLIYPNLIYLTSKMYTTGTNGTSGGFDATGNPTLYLYRENMVPSSTSFISGNYRGISSVSGNSSLTIDGDAGNFSIPAGNGVLMFFRGDKATTTAPTTTSSIAQPTTLTASGYLNQGTITVKNWYNNTNLLYTSNIANASVRGFNLVGNPYASSIDWDKWGTAITGDSVSNVIYIYNPALKVYATYMAGCGGIGTNFNSSTGANIIPSGQGFMVRTTYANPTLRFTEAAKTSTQVPSSNLLMSTQLIADAPDLQYIRLRLGRDEGNADESLIFFKQDAKRQFVRNEDAEYLKGNSILNISTLSSENTLLAINKLPFTNKAQTIPLSINVTSTGLYTISIPEIKNIPKMFDVWLIDAYKKDSLDIKHNSTYNFNANTADAASYGTSRFSLLVRPNKAYVYKLLDFVATKNTVDVKLDWKVENEQNYTYFTLERSTNGGKTFDIIGSRVGNNSSNYSLTDKAPFNGENLYRLKQEDYFGTMTYSKVVPVMYTPKAETSLSKLDLLIYPNPTSTNINVVVNKPSEKAVLYKIIIANSSGLNVRTAETSRPEWNSYIGDLLPGNYFLQVVDTKNNTVIGNSKFVKL